MVYQICIKGEIDPDWLRWLEAGEIWTTEQEDGTLITTIKADCIDQPALFGILDWIRDMNLLPIAIERIDREISAIIDEGIADE